MRILIAAALLAMPVGAANAQSSNRASDRASTITLYPFPGYLGRGVTVSADDPRLTSMNAQSARVTGEWQVCPQANYAGSCRTISSDQPLLGRVQVASARMAGSTASASTSSNASTSAAIDLDALDVDAGTEGQDVAFFARPSFQNDQVAAGTNDMNSAASFCRQAGFGSAAFASRARTQSSNLIDLNARSRVRSFALRDVLCRR